MIVWAIGGIVAGWLLSARLDVGSLALFLISSVVLPLAAFFVLRGFDIGTVTGYATFLALVQVSYLVTNYSIERGRTGEER